MQNTFQKIHIEICKLIFLKFNIEICSYACILVLLFLFEKATTKFPFLSFRTSTNIAPGLTGIYFSIPDCYLQTVSVDYFVN